MPTIFSRIAAGEIPCYKIAADERHFAFLDINPVAPGHVLVIPRREVPYIFDLTDEETGARVVDEEVCIGCGMCTAACPWNMPQVNAQTGTSTKCVSCGRCAEQCPNGAIKFIDWEDIAQKAIDEGVVSTTTIVEA